MNNPYEMRRGYHFKNSIGFVLLVVFLCCILVLIVTMLKVPDIATGNGAMSFHNNMNSLKASDNDNSIGTFGNMMIDMLPEDLTFTVFLPSETTFERDLRLNTSGSLVGEKMNDTYAIISRVLGFSVIPRVLESTMVPAGKEVSYNSLSGFELFVSKDEGGVLVVNGVKLERVDMKRGKLVVHVIDGVIMDAEFEQSIQPDFDDDG